jgi:Family of unknown function (DUF6350)
VLILVLATPYLAGVFGGVITIRVMPTPVLEAAPLWGFCTGISVGALAGLAAAFAGGPLGDGRLAAVGPSGLMVGLVGMLQIGVTSALAAAAANWLILRRGTRRMARSRLAEESLLPAVIPAARQSGVVDETDDAEGHRIYMNPWAAEDEEAEDPDAEDAPDGW